LRTDKYVKHPIIAMASKPQIIIFGFILVIAAIFLSIRIIVRWNGMEEIFRDIQRIEMNSSPYPNDTCAMINDSILNQEHNLKRLKAILVNSYDVGIGGKSVGKWQYCFYFNFFTSTKECAAKVYYYGKDFPSVINIGCNGVSVAERNSRSLSTFLDSLCSK
jgi:hypothetical protein